jgi:glycosyltransferase involved in cell wall biosynthesis
VIKNVVLNRRMRRVGIAEAADVYHAHDLNTLWVGRSCAEVTGARLVYDSHELATERSRMKRVWRWWATRTERRWLPAADALIVASPVWIRILEHKHGSVPDRSVAVLNTPEYQEVEALDVRDQAGLPAGMPVVLYQGSIQEHRGIEPAIDAVAGLDGVALVVVGYGHHRPALEGDVAERGLGDRVRFVGPYPPDLLLRYTASADVGLCTIVSSSLSYHTSLPNKLFEYLMAGVPILGSEAPEIARVVTESGAGVVVPATDPEAIAAGIRRLLADPEPFRAAARRASATFNWGVESAKLVDLYRALEVA